jgi:hypothetical protein
MHKSRVSDPCRRGCSAGLAKFRKIGEFRRGVAENESGERRRSGEPRKFGTARREILAMRKNQREIPQPGWPAEGKSKKFRTSFGCRWKFFAPRGAPGSSIQHKIGSERHVRRSFSHQNEFPRAPRCDAMRHLRALVCHT